MVNAFSGVFQRNRGGNGTGSAPATVSGERTAGSTATATPGDGWLFTAGQWRNDGVNIAGATGLTYVRQQADIGKVLSFVPSGVPYAAPAGATIAAPPAVLTAAAVNGTPTVGTPLSITGATFSGIGNTIVRRIFANSVLVATASSYTPVAGDIGAIFTVVDTATNSSGGSAQSMSANSQACVDAAAPTAASKKAINAYSINSGL